MYEPYQILGAILFGALGLYLAVFYGSALIAYIYGAYLHDGDKEIWSLPKMVTDNDASWTTVDAFGVFGLCMPFTYGLLSVMLVKITEITGMLIPYIILGALSAWATLYVLRSVIRLNKKLDKHASDKDAHK